MFKKCTFWILLLFTIIYSISASAFMIEYDEKITNYTGSVYRLIVNGKEPKLPLEPIIFNDRALVPVREVFEALNAKVTYHEKTKCVEVSYNSDTISLYINNSVAYINGKKTTIPDNAVPKLINKVGENAKTMVPVRFISESLNMNVEFKDPIIYITNSSYTPSTTPKPTTKPTTSPMPDSNIAILKKLTYSNAGNNTLKVVCTISGTPDKVSSFTLKSPTRLVVDLYNCNYSVSTEYDVNIAGIKKIRVGFDDGRARLVFDADNIKSHNASLSGNKLTITVTTGEGSIENTPSPTPSTSPKPTVSPVEITDIPYAEHSNSDKLIVIDAGHGGKDGGASGALDGKTVLEKNLTLQMAIKTRDILTGKGYKVKLTRETDQYPTLKARADFANNSNAAVFVSIHINSADSIPTASGTEVFYAPLNNDTSYGLKSSYLAKYIQEYLIANLSSKDRGVKETNHLITRTAIMPSALVEVGFISNEDELRNMTSSTYQNKTAQAIAAGIIKALEKIEIPDNTDELLQQRLLDLEEWENAQ